MGCSNVQNAISEAGISRGGIAAALAVPLVAVGSLALLSPLALGRKKRDLDGLEESEDGTSLSSSSSSSSSSSGSAVDDWDFSLVFL